MLYMYHKAELLSFWKGLYFFLFFAAGHRIVTDFSEAFAGTGNGIIVKSEQ